MGLLALPAGSTPVRPTGSTDLEASGRGLERGNVIRVALHDEADLVERPSEGVNHDLARLPDEHHSPAVAAGLLDDDVVASGAAQRDAHRRLAEQHSTDHLQWTPQRVVERRIVRSWLPLRLGPSYVFVVDEELAEVGLLTEYGNRKRRPQRRALAKLFDHRLPGLGGDGLRHVGSVISEERDDDRDRRIRAALTHQQVSEEIAGCPALAQRGCVGADLLEQIAQFGTFVRGDAHFLTVTSRYRNSIAIAGGQRAECARGRVSACPQRR